MTTEIHGVCEVRFAPLKEAFAANFDAGLELGSSLGVTHRGRMVVDLWAGCADRHGKRPWERDTIVNTFSTTKIMVALCALMLVDRGLIDLDAPVARYWPQFAAGGKARVTVRDAFTHQAGVPGFDPPVAFEALHDWDSITAHIAASKHWFGGERVYCYHESTYGFVLGELIRRVDGRPPRQFFADELASPLGADFQFGLTSRSDLTRLADLRFPTVGMDSVPDELVVRVNASVGHGSWESWETLSAEMPSGNGYGNGRSVARLCAVLAMGGAVDGHRYLSSKLAAAAVQAQVSATYSKFGAISMGYGVALDHFLFRAPTPTCVHWGGFGGSLAMMDPATGVGLGYTPNNLRFDPEVIQDPRLERFWRALEIVLPRL